MFTACGYHLVGSGDGKGGIPADVETLTVAGNADARLLSDMRSKLVSDQYELIEGSVGDRSHHALLHVQLAPLGFTPSAYDTAGIAIQYRMVFGGSLLLEQGGKTIWQSDPITRQGDVYVTGGPASIEASRTRLLQQLGKQWVSDALGRLRSGF